MRAGEQLALTNTISFTPTTGGTSRAASGSARAGRASRAAGRRRRRRGDLPGRARHFDGTPAELLDQVEKVTSATDDPSFQVDGDPATVTTPAGEVGVVQTYSSVIGDGLVAAFVIDGTGLKITAYGPPAQMTAAAPTSTP